MFCGNISDLVRRSHFSVSRRDVYDPPPVLLLHVWNSLKLFSSSENCTWQTRFDRVEIRGHIDFYDLIKFFDGKFFRRKRCLNSCIIYKNVNRLAELLLRLGDPSSYILRVRNIETYEFSFHVFRSQIFYNFCNDFFRPEAVYRNMRACISQCMCDTKAYSTRAEKIIKMTWNSMIYLPVTSAKWPFKFVIFSLRNLGYVSSFFYWQNQAKNDATRIWAFQRSRFGLFNFKKNCPAACFCILSPRGPRRLPNNLRRNYYYTTIRREKQVCTWISETNPVQVTDLLENHNF